VTFPCLREPLQVVRRTQEVTAGTSLKSEPCPRPRRKGFYRLAGCRRLPATSGRPQDLAKTTVRKEERPAPDEAYFDAGTNSIASGLGHIPLAEAARADLKRLPPWAVTAARVSTEEAASPTRPCGLTQGQSSKVYPPGPLWPLRGTARGPDRAGQGKRLPPRAMPGPILNAVAAPQPQSTSCPVEDYLRGVVA